MRFAARGSLLARALVPSLIAGLALAACRHPATSSFQGTLEITEVDVAPMQPGRVLRVLRQEGDSTGPGDTLVTLTRSTVQADVDARRAELAQAEAQLRDLQAGARSTEISQAEAELRAAEADVVRTQQDLARLTPLAASATISQQQLDAARQAAHSAAARRDAARDALRLLQEGTRPDRIQAAKAAVGTARAALAAAVQTKADLVLVSPIRGTVLSRHAEPGEVLGAGASAMTLGDVTRPYVYVYVDQAVLPTLRVGRQATALLDAFPGHPFIGRIAAINTKAEFTPRVALTRDERADLMFGVKIEFTGDTEMLKAGLPVSIRFNEASSQPTTDGR